MSIPHSWAILPLKMEDIPHLLQFTKRRTVTVFGLSRQESLWGERHMTFRLKGKHVLPTLSCS